MKIVNDKYYTPIYVANQCWEKVKNIIGLDIEFISSNTFKVNIDKENSRPYKS